MALFGRMFYDGATLKVNSVDLQVIMPFPTDVVGFEHPQGIKGSFSDTLQAYSYQISP